MKMLTPEEVKVRVCRRTGKRTGPYCKETEERSFIAGTSPQELCWACTGAPSLRRWAKAANTPHATDAPHADNALHAASAAPAADGAQLAGRPASPLHAGARTVEEAGSPFETAAVAGLAASATSPATPQDPPFAVSPPDLDEPQLDDDDDDLDDSGMPRAPWLLLGTVALVTAVVTTLVLLMLGKVQIPAQSVVASSEPPRVAAASGLKVMDKARRVTLRQSWLEVIPYPVREEKSARLAAGKWLIKQQGQRGSRKVLAQVTYEGQREVARRTLSSQVLKEPVPMVMLAGAAPKEKTTPQLSSSRSERSVRGEGSVRREPSVRRERPVQEQPPQRVRSKPLIALMDRDRPSRAEKEDAAGRPSRVRRKRVSEPPRLRRERSVEQSPQPRSKRRRRRLADDRPRERMTRRRVTRPAPRRESPAADIPLPPVIEEEREAPLPPPL